jgi:hypothetical protein
MKNLIIILFFFFCSIGYVQSQTYINPVVGFDFTNFESINLDPDFHIFEITDKKFGVKSPFYGIKVEQVLTKSISLAINFNFTKKNVGASIFNFIARNGFNMDYYRSGIVVNFRVLSFFSIGIGGNYNKMSKFTYTFREEEQNEFISSWADYGFSVLPRFYWRNFELNSYYYKGLNSNEDRSGLILKPV